MKSRKERCKTRIGCLSSLDPINSELSGRGTSQTFMAGFFSRWWVWMADAESGVWVPRSKLQQSGTSLRMTCHPSRSCRGFQCKVCPSFALPEDLIDCDQIVVIWTCCRGRMFSDSIGTRWPQTPRWTDLRPLSETLSIAVHPANRHPNVSGMRCDEVV